MLQLVRNPNHRSAALLGFEDPTIEWIDLEISFMNYLAGSKLFKEIGWIDLKEPAAWIRLRRGIAKHDGLSQR